MPVWLQIVGAIASAVLGYLGRYDDTKVQDLLKDIAYNLNLALQRLDEISYQLSGIAKALEALPEVIQKIIYAQELDNLNTTIRAAVLQYKQIVTTNPGTDLFEEEIARIYGNVVEARTQLQVRSMEGDVVFAPLAAVVAPIAFLLEMSLLYRRRDARKLRRATLESYQEWFNFLLDENIPASLAANVNLHTNLLAQSDTDLGNSFLLPALNNPGTQQAIYCVEHQIGGSIRSPWDPGKTMAQWLGETWLRVYGLVSAEQEVINRENLWNVDKMAASFRDDVYARNAATLAWYSRTPPWTIGVVSYDSQDIQRFRGQNTAERIADLKNSKMWRTFLVQKWPDALKQVQENNAIRSTLRVALDVAASIKAVKMTESFIDTGRVMAEEIADA